MLKFSKNRIIWVVLSFVVAFVIWFYFFSYGRQLINYVGGPANFTKPPQELIFSNSETREISSSYNRWTGVNSVSYLTTKIPREVLSFYLQALENFEMKKNYVIPDKIDGRPYTSVFEFNNSEYEMALYLRILPVSQTSQPSIPRVNTQETEIILEYSLR